MSIWSNPLLLGTPGGSGVDTGLGWGAKGDWLMDQIGEIGKLTKGSGEYPPSSTQIPYQGPFSNLPAASPGFVRAQWQGNNRYITDYQLNNIGTGHSWAFFVGSTYYNVTDYPGTTVRHLWNDNLAFESDWTPSTSVSGRPGYYERHDPSSWANKAPNFSFSSFDAAMDAIVADNPGSEVSYAKSTAGYSVTCMCKWKTSASDNIYCSPVLISSVESNTAYTRNSTAVTSSSQHSLNDITFYMRKGTSDVFSGTKTVTSEAPLLDLSSAAIYTDDELFYAIILNAGVYIST